MNDPNKIILGEDYVDIPPTPEYTEGVRDRLGHGSHVAGIISAETNNNTGVAGVAGGCRLLICQVFDALGYGDWSWFKSGVIYAVDNGAKVINYSGGGDFPSQQGYDAIAYANLHNVFIAAAVGNDNTDSVSYPAAYSTTFTNLVAVGATDQNDSRSQYSNVGSQLNIVAPGGFGSGGASDIYSTTPNYPFSLGIWYGISQNYGYMYGTSMATPHVAGIAGLLLSVNPDLTSTQVRSIIELTSEDKGVAGRDDYYGYGRVNAYRALLPLIAPVNFRNTAVSGFVTLIWSATSNPILQYYEVERKINSGSWTVIATTTDISYLDNEFRVQSSGFTTAQYRVRQKSINDVYSNYSSIVTVNGMFNPTDKNINIVKLPSEYRLDQNHPNPFNPTTTIQYQIPEDANVVLKVYNLLGSEVATLVNEYKPTGYYEVKFSAKGGSASGGDASSLPSGLYLYKINAGTFSETRKMLLMK